MNASNKELIKAIRSMLSEKGKAFESKDLEKSFSDLQSAKRKGTKQMINTQKTFEQILQEEIKKLMK